MSAQERKLDAAEYVIGTLSAVERSAFEASIDSDANTRADVQFWERVFGSLNASVSPETPNSDVWKRIEEALPKLENPTEDAQTSKSVGLAANDNTTQKLLRSRGRWRFGAIAATIAALGLGAFVYTQQLNLVGPTDEQPVQQAGVLGDKDYVAVVNANGDQPSLVISIDGKTGLVTVRSIGVSPPAGMSLELWYVPEGQKAVSVGLVGEGGIDLKDLTAKDGDLLAVSLEPQGGSPTGTATGPIIYTGKLIEDAD